MPPSLIHQKVCHVRDMAHAKWLMWALFVNVMLAIREHFVSTVSFHIVVVVVIFIFRSLECENFGVFWLNLLDIVV